MKIQPKKPLSLLWPNLNRVTWVRGWVMDDIAKHWLNQSIITEILLYSKDGLYHTFCPKRYDSQGAVIPFPFFPEIWTKPKRARWVSHTSKVPPVSVGCYRMWLSKSPNLWLSLLLCEAGIIIRGPNTSHRYHLDHMRWEIWKRFEIPKFYQFYLLSQLWSLLPITVVTMPTQITDIFS